MHAALAGRGRALFALAALLGVLAMHGLYPPSARSAAPPASMAASATAAMSPTMDTAMSPAMGTAMTGRAVVPAIPGQPGERCPCGDHGHGMPYGHPGSMCAAPALDAPCPPAALVALGVFAHADVAAAGSPLAEPGVARDPPRLADLQILRL